MTSVTDIGYIGRLQIYQAWQEAMSRRDSIEAAIEDLTADLDLNYLDDDDFANARILLEAGHPIDVVAERMERWDWDRFVYTEIDEDEDDDHDITECPRCSGVGYI